MKHKKAIIFSALLQILQGFVIAFLSSLLIYFKQKEYLHLGVVLFSVFVIYYLANLFKERIRLSGTNKTISLIIILIICWIGPQFIYQIRPFTFYISGIAIGGITLAALAFNLLDDNNSIRFPWNSLVFICAFIIGYNIPWGAMQFLVIGLSLLILMVFLVQSNLKVKSITIVSLALLCLTYWFFSRPIIRFEEQANYEDKILFTASSQFHEIVITQWQKDRWVFIDKLKNISSIDEYLFYEPMAHAVFKIGYGIRDVLVIGGENGCLIREILKHKEVDHIEVISYDTLMRTLGEKVDFFTVLNQNAYQSKKVNIIENDLIEFVSDSARQFDAIFIDLPDPRSIETNQYYTLEFYELIKKKLTKNGIMITQAGSPYFATQAYFSIGQTIKAAGFNTLPLHNQILTLGEWGWYICSIELDKKQMKKQLLEKEIIEIETKWFNREAAKLVSSFGKTYNDTLNAGINTLENPMVYQYYLKGNWELN